MALRDDVAARLKKLMAVTDDLEVVAEAIIPLVRDAHIAARLRERADAATGSAQAVMYEIVRMIETGEL